jgi:putative phosphoribosyl transferase
MSKFKDRREAGRELAMALAKHRSGDLVVLALPRGGVPVAYEVACALGAPLDIFVVRKLGAPGEEELAMGALASGGLIVLNDDIVSERNISAEAISEVAQRETHELVRREQLYRGGRQPVNVADKTVIVVDDGLATGASMRAAIRALRKGAPRQIVTAVPIAAPETCSELADEADETVCAVTPEPFRSVGHWYRDFSQTSDDEVRELLGTAWRTESARTPDPVDVREQMTSSNRR